MHNRILVSLTKDPAIGDNINGPRGHFAKWNKPDTEKHITWSGLYLESEDKNSNT
jgi:hypothetical protein